MGRKDSTTMHDHGVPGHEAPRRPADVFAFAVIWCPDEPWRVGEVLLLRGRATSAFGRGDQDIPDRDRAALGRQRPGDQVQTDPIEVPRLSRHQIDLDVRDPVGVFVRNVGQARLYVDGREVPEAEVAPGEVIQLGSTIALLCTRRPWRMECDLAPPHHRFGEVDDLGIVGESPEAWDLRARIRAIATQRAHVLVQGPSGSGKELVARGLHAASDRRSRTLVSRSAATIPETLIEAELFGNAKNYPNAGMPERPGIVGEADGSTLFLDEIGELSDVLQARLLRVLDSGEYQRLGESRTRRSDFRFVGATLRPTETLRPDLFARMSARIIVPGLEARREDVALLIVHILRKIARAEPAAKRFMDDDGWPRLSAGLARRLVQHRYTTHIRELDALLRASMAASPGNFLDVGPEAAAVATETPRPAVDPSDIPPEVVREALERHNWVQSAVWKDLGLSSRHVLARLMKKYGIDEEGSGSANSS